MINHRSQSPQIGSSLLIANSTSLSTTGVTSQSPQIGSSLLIEDGNSYNVLAYKSQSPQIGSSLLIRKIHNSIKANLVSIPSNRVFSSDLCWKCQDQDDLYVSIPSNRVFSSDYNTRKAELARQPSQSPQIGSSLLIEPGNGRTTRGLSLNPLKSGLLF